MSKNKSWIDVKCQDKDNNLKSVENIQTKIIEKLKQKHVI
jgi:hypothetical protein